MSKTEYRRRCIMIAAGAVLSGISLAFGRNGAIGGVTTASAGVVLSLKTGLTTGTCVIFTSIALMLLQAVILGRRFKPIQLWQAGLAVIYGVTSDLFFLAIRQIPSETYPQKLLMVLGSLMFSVFGKTLYNIAGDNDKGVVIVKTADDSFVAMITDMTKGNIDAVKWIFDICYVGLAVLLSFIFFGELRGVREGVIIVAVGSFFLTKLFVKLFAKPLTSLLKRGIPGSEFPADE